MKNSTSRPKIVSGYRCGKLTVQSKTERRKNGYIIWSCQCGCGGHIDLDTRTLQRGTVCSCGCDQNVRPGQKDITGQRFGKLTVLTPTEKRTSNGSTIWKCACDCGNTVFTSISQLMQGTKKSCGCMNRSPVHHLQGHRFGDLTAEEYVGKRNGWHYWQCVCACGNRTSVKQCNLLGGKTKSCGCLQARIIAENMKFVDGTSVTLLEKAGERILNSNTSGYNGIYQNKKTKKWIAQIGFKGKNYYLGSFDNIENAIYAREQAEKQIYGQFLDWYYKNNSGRKTKYTDHDDGGSYAYELADD